MRRHRGSGPGLPSFFSISLGQGSEPLTSLLVLFLSEHAQLGNPEKDKFLIQIKKPKSNGKVYDEKLNSS